jgi:hypothetical protein
MCKRISKNERLRLISLWNEGNTEEVEKEGYTVRKIKGDKIQLKRIITEEEKEERKNKRKTSNKQKIQKKQPEEEQIPEEEFIDREFEEEIPKSTPQPKTSTQPKILNKKFHSDKSSFKGLTQKEKIAKINTDMFIDDGIARKDEKMLNSKTIQDMTKKPRKKTIIKDDQEENYIKPNIL